MKTTDLSKLELGKEYIIEISNCDLIDCPEDAFTTVIPIWKDEDNNTVTVISPEDITLTEDIIKMLIACDGDMDYIWEQLQENNIDDSIYDNIFDHEIIDGKLQTCLGYYVEYIIED